MKKIIITWIAKTICKKIWENYTNQIKLKDQQLKNLKKKNYLLLAEMNAYREKTYKIN